MKQRYILFGSLFVMAALIFVSVAPRIAAQDTPPPGLPVHLLVTVEARHGSVVPDVPREDVLVFQGRDRRKTTEWIPLQGDRAGLQLFILIDDAANDSLGSQLPEIAKFIQAQPASTKIGVAYMSNGTAQVRQELTSDHDLAAKSLRLPVGNLGASASPYFAIGDLIKKWPAANERREVVVISDGIDRYWGAGPGDPYVDTAIQQAQIAGVVVFGMYTPGEGHFGHSPWRMNWGQNYLSQIADETGGEAYYLGNGAPVSFGPYFEDLSKRLTHQYLLTFSVTPKKKAGMQQVKVETEVPNAELVSADKVFVPAAQ
jgi:hypothetical protein